MNTRQILNTALETVKEADKDIDNGFLYSAKIKYGKIRDLLTQLSSTLETNARLYGSTEVSHPIDGVITGLSDPAKEDTDADISGLF